MYGRVKHAPGKPVEGITYGEDFYGPRGSNPSDERQLRLNRDAGEAADRYHEKVSKGLSRFKGRGCRARPKIRYAAPANVGLQMRFLERLVEGGIPRLFYWCQGKPLHPVSPHGFPWGPPSPGPGHAMGGCSSTISLIGVREA